MDGQKLPESCVVRCGAVLCFAVDVSEDEADWIGLDSMEVEEKPESIHPWECWQVRQGHDSPVVVVSLFPSVMMAIP